MARHFPLSQSPEVRCIPCGFCLQSQCSVLWQHGEHPTQGLPQWLQSPGYSSLAMRFDPDPKAQSWSRFCWTCVYYDAIHPMLS
ncbi:hypothetical protein VNO77_23003 [Canavalia gladiata]|uniref:Uncharacterized protein n=1 Tax=Canavalia gladiata TaxID=3824 RepID=A0AAN9L462_CANGL